MRVALLTHNARAGDAIGNQVAEKLTFFLERGADVRVFLESERNLHPAIAPHWQRLNHAQPAGQEWQFLVTADLVVVEYSQYYSLLELLPLIALGKPRILFDYHGVTPAGLWKNHHREALEKGTRQRGLAWFADSALAHSEFTRRDLQEASDLPAERLHVLAHPLDLGRSTPGRPRRHLLQVLGLDEATLLLFVGRLAPNKRVPLLVEALSRLGGRTPAVHLAVLGDTSDIYEAEAKRCRQVAADHQVADRLHFLGHVDDQQLLDAYRSADIFVMPSIHEGFCIPVLEAMACGLPVVAARAAALPETVGPAGLTFAPDDVDDLVRQISRLLPARRPVNPGGDGPEHWRLLKVALVAFRYGTAFVGGAESSVRKIANTLSEAGHQAEVFTTCTQSENEWGNHLPEGTVAMDGIPVHRYRLDAQDRANHLDSVRHILEKDGKVSPEVEEAYLRHSIHSTRLLEALAHRIDEFDAVLAGPYLFGLTHDIARAFKEKTVLMPCFHDEPFARLKIWPPAYGQVGAILYHSQAEKSFAETELAVNHPGAVCLGTVLNPETCGDAERGRSLARARQPYVAYCGRYSLQKKLPTLLQFARRYAEIHPERFAFVFMGEGEVGIPREDWACNLGFVEEQAKHDVLAGAAALIQLSHYESLSLVALEAWAQGTPVIADQRCAVLAGHLAESGAGQTISGFDSFAAALDDLWAQPERWRAMGQRGQEYVRTHYASRDKFRQTLEEALWGLRVPISEHMRRQGLLRAAEHGRALWRERFGRLIEDLLDAPALPHREKVEIQPRITGRTAPAGQDCMLIPVRVANRGTHPAMHEGPARMMLRAVVMDEAGQPCAFRRQDTPLPGLLLPGQEISAAIRVPVPPVPGSYRVGLFAERIGRQLEGATEQAPLPEMTSIRLNITQRPVTDRQHSAIDSGCCASSLESIHAALAEATNKQTLPDNYTDVTEGLLANLKRRIKSKLLGNFKHAYVDVLSRQQTAFNQQMIAALQELAECCAMLDHAQATAKPDATQSSPLLQLPDPAHRPFLAAWIEKLVAAGKADELAALVHSLQDQLAESRTGLRALEARVAGLEAVKLEKDKVTP